MTRLNWQEIAPEGAKALFGIHHYVTKKTNLPEELVHLVFLRVSQINGCAPLHRHAQVAISENHVDRQDHVGTGMGRGGRPVF